MPKSLVFIAHDSREKPRVLPIYEFLLSKGLDVWIDKFGLDGGMLWDKEIKSRLAQTKFFLIILSELSIKKDGYFLDEIRTALHYANLDQQDKFLIPLFLDPIAIPDIKFGASTLNQHQGIMLFQEDGLEKLLQAIIEKGIDKVITKDSILRLISEGQTDKALKVLIEETNSSSDEHQKFILLRNRFQELMEQKHLNLITSENYFMNLAQVNHSLVNLINSSWKSH